MRMTLVGCVVFLTTGTLFVACAGNEATNAVVWGTGIKGVSMRVSPEGEEFKLGKPMPVTVCVTNGGAKTVTLLVEGGEDEMYRLDLFDSGGCPVETQRKGRFEGGVDEMIKMRVFGDEVRPGEARKEGFMLDKYFHIRKAGTYYLIAQRVYNPGLGTLMSNMVIIRVVE